jgi:hypothetical protein
VHESELEEAEREYVAARVVAADASGDERALEQGAADRAPSTR